MEFSDAIQPRWKYAFGERRGQRHLLAHCGGCRRQTSRSRLIHSLVSVKKTLELLWRICFVHAMVVWNETLVCCESQLIYDLMIVVEAAYMIASSSISIHTGLA